MKFQPQVTMKAKTSRSTYSRRNDLRVSVSEVSRAAASAVGRVAHNTMGWQGTGCMISKQLFITNNHVILNSQKATDYVVEFNYELNANNCPKQVTKFALAPNILFLSSPEEELDFTIVAVGKRISGRSMLSHFGYCPMKDLGASERPGTLISIIGHPRGRFKQTAIRSAMITAMNDEVLQYYADVEVGSSGSPIFNDGWQLIGLHHWGAPTRKISHLRREQVSRDVREGIRICAIVRKMVLLRPDLSEKERSLVDEALSYLSSTPICLRYVKQ